MLNYKLDHLSLWVQCSWAPVQGSRAGGLSRASTVASAQVSAPLSLSDGLILLRFPYSPHPGLDVFPVHLST